MEAHKLSPALALLENDGKDHLSKDYLLHPGLDVLMVGGVSIIVFSGMHLFVDTTASTHKIGWLMFYLSFLVNFPHFMSTYFLFYKEHKQKVLTQGKFIWAGVIAPVLLLSLLAGLSWISVSQGQQRYIGYMANLMFLLVGHHYVKQVYGCIMVMSAKRKFYFDKLECKVLWANMYSVWMMSFISSNAHAVSSHELYGINYTTLGLHQNWLLMAYTFSIVSFLSFCSVMLRRYVKDGKVMPLTAWVAMASIFIWYIPSFHHPHFFYMIPLFHSLQYLLFSVVFKINKTSKESSLTAEGPQNRLAFLRGMGSFTLFMVGGGYFAWSYLPNFLDQNFKVASILGATYFMFATHIFLNLHHYIIDNVLWRKDNDTIKAHL